VIPLSLVKRVTGTGAGQAAGQAQEEKHLKHATKQYIHDLRSAGLPGFV